MKNTSIACGLLLVAAAWLSGCTSVQVKPLDAAATIHHLCIQENPRVTVPGFIGILQDGIQRNGLTSEVYAASKPPHCDYILSYTALRSWDLGTYLSHAELRIDRDGRQVASAQYHLRGKGGLALNKWKSAESKMAPVIDELLAGVAHRSSASAPAPESARSGATPSSAPMPTAVAHPPASATGGLAYSGDPADTALTLTRTRNCVKNFQRFSQDGGRNVYSASCWGDKKLLVACEAGVCSEMR